jgi:hypothetical protein
MIERWAATACGVFEHDSMGLLAPPVAAERGRLDCTGDNSAYRARRELPETLLRTPQLPQLLPASRRDLTRAGRCFPRRAQAGCHRRGHGRRLGHLPVVQWRLSIDGDTGMGGVQQRCVID